MTADLDRFRRTLEDEVEAELSGIADSLADGIVSRLWNACDDERGRLMEENRRLNKMLAERDREIAELKSAEPTLDDDQPGAPQ